MKTQRSLPFFVFLDFRTFSSLSSIITWCFVLSRLYLQTCATFKATFFICYTKSSDLAVHMYDYSEDTSIIREPIFLKTMIVNAFDL